MDVEKAYNIWAEQYDTNSNKTRDLEAESLRSTLSNLHFESCLEIGCGTGKNTQWLLEKATHITAVDLSEQMLSRARQKIQSEKVRFIQADILQEWNFTESLFDLITFSLVLEHIENLNKVFAKASAVLKPSGIIYISELHPYKQYSGTKARFHTNEGIHIVECFNHHISDFTSAAKNQHFEIKEIIEYFDDENRLNVPRILTLVFKKIN